MTERNASKTSEGAATGRLFAVVQRIHHAAIQARRDPAGVTLIAVSKTFAPDDIVPVLDAGQRVFGENRVQEAAAKWPELRQRYGGTALHLIGPLQSNKTRDAVALFDAIHSVDRLKIAQTLAEEMARQAKRPQLFIQINTGGEPRKAGIAPAGLGPFLSQCRDDLGLAIAGLMCIPPADDEAGIHFAFLAQLAKAHGLEGLSMGMSADFETAVSFGATHVRVGSAIFGARS